VTEISTSIEIEGAKNLTLHVVGNITKNVSLYDILKFADLRSPVIKLRLESVTFAIQEKAGFYLWWRGKGSEKSLILPLESRGWFDFEKVGCIMSPADATGIAISSFNVTEPKAFRLILDMSKQ
jgi:hypothetical protein